MRHDDADKPDGPPDGHGGAGRDRRREERPAMHRRDVDAACAGGVHAEAEEIQRPGEPREHRKREGDKGQRAENRPVADHVEIAHEPADGAECLRKVAEIFDEENQRREERVERDAREKKDRGRQSFVPGLREEVDDQHRDERPRQTRAGDADKRQGRAESDRQHCAECGAGGDTERVWRREGISQESLENHARGRERAADKRRGKHTR